MPDKKRAEKYLIVVESPAKTKTIKKFLGSDYEVVASMGHIKDLPKSRLGVDVKTFTPEYELLKAKLKIVSAIKKAATGATTVYLAPDPDREGEAIAWHIADELVRQDAKIKIYRVMFNEITRQAVLDGIKNHGRLNKNMYESYLARRILDRLVGYQISPLLWERVKRGLSAGRVQSVAVRLICDREREREAFVPQEYWSITGSFLTPGREVLEAKLFSIDGKGADIPDKDAADALVMEIRKQIFAVAGIELKERKSYPLPPFITSTLQQEAVKRLRFTADRTMKVAQKLYEGVELGKEGHTALITYMRTDSVRIAGEALSKVREYIDGTYGRPYLPAAPNAYRNKKSAQDAHEAIRPTRFDLHPDKVRKFLSDQEYALYRLIWERFVASQMTPAVFKQVTVNLAGGRFVFRATGSTLSFDGYLKVYEEQREEALLPALNDKDRLVLKDVTPHQHFTEPPPRYTEASLVKELEEKGIGRPSTYATILFTIQQRGYVVREEGRFAPTELGTIVTGMLIKNFPQIMDIGFTADMEDKLDSVEEGSINYIEILKAFYRTFEDLLVRAGKQMKNMKSTEEKTDITCEKCGSPMVIKWGRNGSFLACSNYPECKNTKNFRRNEGGGITVIQNEKSGQTCELCGGAMLIKRARAGARFLGCENYPECKNTRPYTIDVKCPVCGGGIAERSSKKGRLFYGCTNYPKCDFVSWNRPVARACPKCGSKYLVEKYTQKAGMLVACPNKACDYIEKE
ncbi:MAG: type I DNA topoisomerase [Deltaproteobacteria bacterium]|nr:type I DNA topoisomerase [Deltaproteobacteria bacterium]MCL5277187.1 type I DNA topoisomerase [Deltaproteobacteria bacterium]